MSLDRAFIQSALSGRSATVGAAFAAAPGVSTDTRSIGAGDLFVALVGERFDGHDFVNGALQQGASAALVSMRVDGVDPARLIVVDDTLLALQDLAHAHLQRLSAKRVALSGSNGKTTTKELIAAALRGTYGDDGVSATLGNLNNHIGLPLTALKVTDAHRAVVLEMGMNHFDEIALLCRIAVPDVGLLTNIGTAHAGNVGGIDGVAKAKGELFEGLAAGATAIINLDDERIVAVADRVLSPGVARLTFGSASGDVRVVSQAPVAGGTALVLSHDGQQVEVMLPLVGAHNAVNAAGAVAAAMAAGCAFATSVEALVSVTNVPGRLEVLDDVGGRLVIDDTYNANPDSMKVAFAALMARAAGRRPVAVLGQMLELGDDAALQHAAVAEAAVLAGIERLFISGELSRGYISGAMRAGLDEADVTWAEDSAALAPLVEAATGAGDAIIVKGSRGARMERVVERLLAGGQPAPAGSSGEGCD
jgi:UDP-N-acetylmuramoyl-tripeptide--D-alanyl-D-alanine ligase